jgi:hypothetical protein
MRTFALARGSPRVQAGVAGFEAGAARKLFLPIGPGA